MDACSKCGADLTLPDSVHARTISPIPVRGSYAGGQLGVVPVLPSAVSVTAWCGACHEPLSPDVAATLKPKEG